MMNADCSHSPDEHAEATLRTRTDPFSDPPVWDPQTIRIVFESLDKFVGGDLAGGTGIAIYVDGRRIIRIKPDDARDMAAALCAMADAHDRRFRR